MAGAIRQHQAAWKSTSHNITTVFRLDLTLIIYRNYGDSVMSLIDDIGNALRNVVGAMGNVLTTTVNAVADTLKSTVDTITGLFHRLFR